MNEQKWKVFFQNEADREAEAIMQQVNADPNLADLKAPPEIWEALKKQIEEYERSKEGGQ